MLNSTMQLGQLTNLTLLEADKKNRYTADAPDKEVKLIPFEGGTLARTRS